MKFIFIFLFVFSNLSCLSQTVEVDTLLALDSNLTIKKIEKQSIQVPFYKIDTCMYQLLNILVSNCNANFSHTKPTYGYLFYSKQVLNGFHIIVKPFETTKFSKVNFYAVFEVGGRFFYCIGDKPNYIMNQTHTFLNVESYVTEDLYEELNHNLIDRFAHLHTEEVKKSILLYHKVYSFAIQPCENYENFKKHLSKCPED